ncbi:MAG: hypothetical protein AB4290_30015, partial [Spirulina sp.]
MFVIIFNQFRQQNSIDKLQKDAIQKITESQNSIENKVGAIEQNIDREIANTLNNFDRTFFKKLQDIDNILQISLQEKANLITNIDATDIFDGFIGEYIAFNDPLQYELPPSEKSQNKIEFYVGQYQNERLKKATYYYPIFKHNNSHLNNNWLIKNIKKFWQTLARDGNLTPEQKLKINFYVPDENFQYSPTSEITYFVGTKMTGQQAIVCLHN